MILLENVMSSLFYYNSFPNDIKATSSKQQACIRSWFLSNSILFTRILVRKTTAYPFHIAIRIFSDFPT